MGADGVNDARAGEPDGRYRDGLKESAAAIEPADIAFAGHDLRPTFGALAHAHRGRRIMTPTIGLALAFTCGVLFPLALFGILGPAGEVLLYEVAEVSLCTTASAPPAAPPPSANSLPTASPERPRGIPS